MSQSATSLKTPEYGIVVNLLGELDWPPGGPESKTSAPQGQSRHATYPQKRSVEPGSVVWFCNNLPVDVQITFTASPFIGCSNIINIGPTSVSYPLIASDRCGQYEYAVDAYGFRYFGQDPIIIVDQPTGPTGASQKC